MVGLGVMGQNLVLNIERHCQGVSVYNRSFENTDRFIREHGTDKDILAARDLQEFVKSLERPRKIMLLVKAGPPVDSTILQLAALLEPGDLIIDGGNSYFRDTERRAEELRSHGLNFLGMGVSGGAEGALLGPSLMPGGSDQAYRDVEDLLKHVAAKAEEDGEPCVTYIGPGGSGHYVKMVHNGIEYGDMQLIAEAYDLLKSALGLSAQEFHAIFDAWNRSELASFLIEVTAKVFTKIDDETGKPLVDVILDKAGQKGTGKWTTQDATDLGAAVPTITAAVDGRIISARKEERLAAASVLAGPLSGSYRGSREQLVEAVRTALYASKICSYAQGMALLRTASEEYKYHLNLGDIAKIWRAGCIIRARLLSDITRAFRRDPQLQNLLVDPFFQKATASAQEGWRFALRTAVELGVPMPAMNASLSYYDSYRRAQLPANLIQAQRDFFGAHTFERIDKPGSFHAEWS
jgi:6-phosphogluconate dehydrogenase